MASNIHDLISLYAGDTWVISATINDSAGADIDLTGATVSWAVSDINGNAMAALNAAAVITVKDAPTGAVTITLAPAASAAVPGGYYFDRLKVTLPDGTVATESTGEIQVI